MSRRYTIAVAQLKGGAGKTTLAVCLAAELYKRGNTVILTDADAQRSACQWARPGNLQFPVDGVPLTVQTVATWVHKLVEVAKSYNYVVIDSAPHEWAVSASVAVSDIVVVPCTPSGLDLNATARTLEIIDRVRVRKRGHPSLILVPNRVDTRTREGLQIGAALTRFNEVVSPTIGDRAAFVRAFTTGHTVAEMPEGLIAYREIQTLCDLVEKTLGTTSVGTSDCQPSLADD